MSPIIDGSAGVDFPRWIPRKVNRALHTMTNSPYRGNRERAARVVRDWLADLDATGEEADDGHD